MGKDPKWYEALPKWAQETVDQAGHLGIGIGCGLTSAYLYAWWRENVKQWPPGDPIFIDPEPGSHEDCEYSLVQYEGYEEYFPADRVWDKSKDELFNHIGYMLGNLTRAGLLIYGGIKWW